MITVPTVRELFHNTSQIKIAHRGASANYPENTLPSFQGAIELGAQMIELDVHLTLDEELVIIHDATLDRTTDHTGEVAMLPWHTMAKADAGSWRGESFRHTPLPRLQDVLAWLPNDIMLNLELKGTPHTAARLAAHTLNALNQFHCEERVLLSSFNHELLATLRKLHSNIALGAIFYGRLWPPLALAKELDLFSLHAHVASIDDAWVQFVRSQNYEVIAWTLTTQKHVQVCKESGVKAFVVDDLSLLSVS
ncbi:hypothetical protein BM613_06505 [Sulfoacidibacillus thermotolerans]|uniref:GP-PDE domain-containing protein n=2 Tax=Sulfoacidibacillus thermotolerans TaxID=1765684 RepID=A0A2U3D9E3_SULT2|nr:hypothetical protein BM613_06505 [Sulfoacidibacillus thermotolerans]